ncbi:MAG: ABC transporter permease [Promethearchaeota archaeon]|nr:MAG: ABC transporter permease [Candidatus Lokiarchaeota archaeon]
MSLHTIKFAIKNAFRKKLIAILSLSGIAIGIALMVVLSSATAGMDEMMTNTLAKKIGDVEATEYNKQGVTSILPKNITDIIQTINSSEKIEAISPEIYVTGFQQYAENYSLPSMVELEARGLFLENDGKFDGSTTEISEGRVFENDFEVIIADFIQERNPDDFALNTELVFRINSTYSINIKIVGIFETEDGPIRLMDPIFLMNIETARTINSLSLPFTQEGYNIVRIRFDSDDIDETNDYASELKTLQPKLSYTILSQAAEASSSVMETFDVFTLTISIISITAGGMAIIVAQLMGVNERMKEFAIMKATGWSNGSIYLDIICESIVVALIGSLVGLGLGLILNFAIEGIMNRSYVKITWQLILSVFGFGLGIGLLGGLLPGYKAANVKPMEVIKGL